jgi:hypothetical protein
VKMSRLYASKRISELEELFTENKKDSQVLARLLEELSHRKMKKKVRTLMKELERAIGNCEDGRIEPETVASDVQLHNDRTDQPVFVPQDWDVEQRAVIELTEDDTKIVEAGPGAGKTAVACARVAYLIEKCELSASKILLISFTRTAVKELRDRIEAFSEDPINVAGLRIFTLDSFTWQVLRGLGDDESADLMRSYETNINRLVQQLKDGDEQLQDYLEEFEHVVLDEGQDLVGDRAELAIQIIRNIEENCGVTVFSDSAQAIYGFTDDSEEHGIYHSLTVVERIMMGEIEGFERKKLLNVHRTNDPNLKQLFIEGRDRLLDRKKSNIDGWKSMKALITDCAHGKVGDVKSQELAGKSDHLVLFRTRAEVLMASSFLWGDGIVHRLRMSGIAQQVLPWIGRVLGEIDQEYLELDDFLELWRSKIDDETLPHRRSPELAWQLLLDNAGDRDCRVDVPRLREILCRDRPPIDFLIDESQLAGPVLGTIHASKGREANVVHLMLPPDEFIDDNPESDYGLNPAEIAEEERVLFVGATRAKQKLMIGNGTKMYASRYEKRRTYKRPRKWKNARLIEVGLESDIDIVSIADGRLGERHSELQAWLWGHATSRVDLESRFDGSLNANVLFAVDEDIPIAILGNRFVRDLWGIAELVGQKNSTGKQKPASTIKNIRMIGAATVAIPESQREQLAAPWRHSGFMLAPVITGFPMVFFNNWKKG